MTETENSWIVHKANNDRCSDTKGQDSNDTEMDAGKHDSVIDEGGQGAIATVTKVTNNSSRLNRKHFRKRTERSNFDQVTDCDLDQGNKKKQIYSCNGCNKEFVSERGFTYHRSSVCDKIKKEFKCMICSETFKTNIELVMHKKIHVNEQNFFCYQCKVAYSKQLDYLLHIVNHSQNNLQHCKECNQYFTKRVYKDHIQTHFDEPSEGQQPKKFYKTEKSYSEPSANEIKCGECGRACETKQSFENHMAAHAGIKQYQCLYCGKGFFNEFKRNIHTKMRHTNYEKPFKCDKCPYKAKELRELKQHVTIHINIKEKRFQCDICQKLCPSRDSLTTHKRRVHPGKLFHCMDCSFCCKTKHYLKYHIIHMHTDDKLFYCDECNLGCKTKPILKRHIINKHTNEMKFSCDVCKKLFKHKGNLNRHKRTIHSKNVFHCTECNFSCKTKYNLSSHTSHMHTEGKEFHCSVCNKGYKTKNSLKSHVLNRHTQEKKFLCDVCMMGFNQQGVLNKHKRTVHCEKRFHCTECNKGCKTKTNLKIHMRVHEQGKLFNCGVCKIGFNRYDHLKRHYARKKHKDKVSALGKGASGALN